MDSEDRVLVSASLAVLAHGSEGDAVTRLQALLNVAGAAGLAEDGIFGPLTEAAVCDFQASYALIVDGIVGSQTWTALLSVDRRFPEVIVQQPEPFDIVDNPILISGIGRGFEGTISTRALDADGNTLAEGFVQGGAMALATFQGELAISSVPSNPQGSLEIGPARVTDEGPPPLRVVIAVVSGQPSTTRTSASTLMWWRPARPCRVWPRRSTATPRSSRGSWRPIATSSPIQTSSFQGRSSASPSEPRRRSRQAANSAPSSRGR